MADSLRASEQGLKRIDEARRKKGWNKTAASWCGAAATAEATLKRFWRGLPILRDTFIEICAAVGVTDWEAIAASELDITMEHWWAGRRSLLRDLTAVLQGDCCILVITGITGLGKTALGNRLAVNFDDPWQKDGVNFDAYEQPPAFATVATQWLQSWHDAPTTEEQQNPEMLRQRLIQKLKQEPYWLQIDSLEAILQRDNTALAEDSNLFFDSGWAHFFRQLLAEPQVRSRCVITSQDLPAELVDLRYQGRWYAQRLTGLEPAEQLELFQKAGLETSAASTARQLLHRVGSAYEGHPLALQTIAGEIMSLPFQGNVAAYWKRYGHEIEEVEKARRQSEPGLDPLRIHAYTRTLTRQVQARVEKAFERLRRDAFDAYALLCQVAIYREPVPEAFWLSHLQDYPWYFEPERQEVALDTLRDRYLVEEQLVEDEVRLRLHTLIRSVALEHLKKLEMPKPPS